MNNHYQPDFTKLKPVNYNRRSSEDEDKQILSIPSQLDEAKRISDYYKLPRFVETFGESKSAKKEFNRPDFLQMIKAGTADSIVCWKLDRLARNMTEGGMLIDLLSSGVLKAIITHDKVYYPTDNVLLMSVEFGQGKQFIKDLSTNVKRGQSKKASMGVPHGVAALGFLNDRREEKGNRKWMVDALRLKMIKQLFDMFLTGNYSAGKLYKYATEVLMLTTVIRKKSGGQIIAPSRIYEILKDPIYAGFFFYGGERYELDTDLPRLITEAQHKRVKMLLSGKNIPKTQHHVTTYSGFIVSEEGNFIGPDVKFQVICDCKNKFAYRNKTHCPKCGVEIDCMENPKYLSYVHYYDVKCKKFGLKYKSINEKLVDVEIEDLFINNLSFSPDITEWSKKYIHEMKEKELSEKIIITQRKVERVSELQEKKAKTRALLRDGKITDEEYNQDITILNESYIDTQKGEEGVDWYSRLIEITDIASRMEKVFKSDEVQAKRNILSALGSNLTWNGEKLIITNTKEVDALIVAIKRSKELNPQFEPRNYAINKGSKEKTEPLDPVFSTMLALQDDFRTINWLESYPFPSVMLEQSSKLLAKIA